MSATTPRATRAARVRLERPAAVGGRVLRTPDDRLSVRWRPRTLVVCGGLLGLIAVVAALALTTGSYPVPLSHVVAALVGEGTRADRFVVVTLRLPRLLAALLIGAALGTSGAIFQSLSRNVLGSPDIIGFTSGAATGAVVQIVLLHGGRTAIALAALGGGLLTALVVYVLSATRGTAGGSRLVLVGIGVTAILTSVTSWLLTRASLYDAENAQVWLIGSLNAVGWEVVRPLVLALAVLLPVTVLAGRPLALMEMGEETARNLGVRLGAARLLLIVVGTALAAAATAAAGPIAFVALAAPQLVRRLTHAPTTPLLPSAVMGALLLAASDLAAQRLVPQTQMPVGVMTGLVGGAYLCWLLAHEWRTGRS